MPSIIQQAYLSIIHRCHLLELVCQFVRVKILNHDPCHNPITTTGVPQGPVLSLHFFTLYGNDLPTAQCSTVGHGSSVGQDQVDAAYYSKIRINVLKLSVCVCFNSSSQHFTEASVSVAREGLQIVSELKYIGIQIDRGCGYDDNCDLKLTIQKV